MDNLFAYGTLMCKDIMEEVSSYLLSGVAGTLNGYCRRSVKGEHYPALIPDGKGHVEGVIYRNVPQPAWERLDRFEGEMYTRTLVKTILSNGVTVPAETYVMQPAFFDLLEESEWDFDDFFQNGKQRFQAQYKGYQSLQSSTVGRTTTSQTQ